MEDRARSGGRRSPGGVAGTRAESSRGRGSIRRCQLWRPLPPAPLGLPGSAATSSEEVDRARRRFAQSAKEKVPLKRGRKRGRMRIDADGIAKRDVRTSPLPTTWNEPSAPEQRVGSRNSRPRNPELGREDALWRKAGARRQIVALDGVCERGCEPLMEGAATFVPAVEGLPKIER